MNNILFVTFNLDSYSGAAFQALKLSEELKINEKQVVICNFTRNRIKQENPIYGKHHHLHPDKLISYFLFFKILLRNNISVVHFHVFLKKFLLLAILIQKKVVVKTTLIGDDDFDTIMKSRVPQLSKYIIRNIAINVVLSEYTKKINSKHLPLSKIKRIPNGVEITKHISTTEKEKAFFCTVGVVCKRKQTLEVIKYFHVNYSHLKDSLLNIIGPNDINDHVPEFDESYYALCQEYVAKNNLGKSVLFRGRKSKKEVTEYYKKSVGFLFFSLKEGMPNVLLEAMSFNCVPVVTEMDGVSAEVIEHGINGFILKDLKEQNISIEDILKILKSQFCYEKVKTQFAFSKIGKRYLELYENINYDETRVEIHI